MDDVSNPQKPKISIQFKHNKLKLMLSELCYESTCKQNILTDKKNRIHSVYVKLFNG